MNKVQEGFEFSIGSLVGFYLDHGYTKGRLVRLSHDFDTLVTKNRYPGLVSRYIAEATALVASLCSDGKYQGTFTLQITAQPDSKGIIRLIVIDMNDKGQVRAYARWDEESLKNYLKREQRKDIEFRTLFDQAYLVFTADLRDQIERYQAIVELTGSSLSESMHYFFRQSEQIPTVLMIYSQEAEQSILELNNGLDKGGEDSLAKLTPLKAGAIILQRLPSKSPLPLATEEAQEEWITDISLLKTLTQRELLDPTLEAAQLIHRLFHERDLKILDSRPITFYCSCNRERLKKVFESFSRVEMSEMAVDHSIKATCEFCSIEYTFPLEEGDSK